MGKGFKNSVLSVSGKAELYGSRIRQSKLNMADYKLALSRLVYGQTLNTLHLGKADVLAGALQRLKRWSSALGKGNKRKEAELTFRRRAKAASPPQCFGRRKYSVNGGGSSETMVS